jgi:hypothetical protein
MQRSALFALPFLLMAHTAQAAPPSHKQWDQLLRKHVSATGAVNYKGFKQDQALLQVYLDSLAAQAPQPGWTQNARLAYWINAYNAFTVKLILDHYPLKSIRDLGKPWDLKFITLGGQPYSLNDIEHTILRKQFSEPRIHFAVNCASKSCPPLLNQAYTAERIQTQLARQASAFINDRRFNQTSAGSASLSKIFEWYQADFVKNGTLIDYLNRYATIKLTAGATLTYMEYDWSLNE